MTGTVASKIEVVRASSPEWLGRTTSALRWTVWGYRGLSPNERRGKHWIVSKRDRDRWGLILMAADGREAAQDAWRRPSVVGLVVVPQGRPELDLDGSLSAAKGCIDAIVAGGWIADDKPSVVPDVRVLRGEPDATPGVVIELRSLDREDMEPPVA